MKKRILAVLLAASTVLALTGCGSEENPAYLKNIKASDYVDLCDLSNITVSVPAETEVTDDMVQNMIDYTLSSDAAYQEVTDRDTVEEGDTVNIDYVGKKDGVEFDGGSATGYDLTIGSGSFIDGFEDGLIGHKVGETVDLNLTFPEDYSNEDLAGQDVVFTVTINKIEAMTSPDFTDEWVADQNITGVETTDQYREYSKEQMVEYYDSSYESSVQEAIVEYLLDNCTFKQDPPEEMVQRYYDNMVDYYSQQLSSSYGIDLDTYTSLMGLDEDSSDASTEDAAAETTEDASAESTEATEESSADETETEDASADTTVTEESAADGTTAAEEETKVYQWIMTDAVKQAKRYIILQAIADEKDLNLSTRELKSKLSTEAAQEGYSSLDDFIADEEMSNSYREYLMSNSVLEWLTDNVTVTDLDEDADTTEAADTAETEAAAEDASVAETEAAE